MDDSSRAIATELEWQVNGLCIAGLRWGTPGAYPVLALHGWLDNAASFSRLAPLLANCDVVALDLTGHGKSDHRSLDATYNLWDDIPEVMAVADQLGWEKFALLGHSRGAIISTVIASAFPERINHLGLIDGIWPLAIDHKDTSEQIRKFVLDKHKYNQREHKMMATLDEAVERRSRHSTAQADALRPIIMRNLHIEEEGVRWTTDPRLNGASAVKFTESHIQAVLNKLKIPTQLFLAEGGFTAEKFKRILFSYPDIMVTHLPGTHHLHLEESAYKIAESLNSFYVEKMD